MDYIKKLEQIDAHLAEHPKDYQAVIGRMKTYSKVIDHERHLRKIERLKRLAEVRRQLNEEQG